MDLHYEVELALVMGKTVKDLEAGDMKGALDAIESAFLFPQPSIFSFRQLSQVKFNWIRTDFI